MSPKILRCVIIAGVFLYEANNNDFVFILVQTIEDTNGTSILDQSVIKKGRNNNNTHIRTHLCLTGFNTNSQYNIYNLANIL